MAAILHRSLIEQCARYPTYCYNNITQLLAIPISIADAGWLQRGALRMRSREKERAHLGSWSILRGHGARAPRRVGVGPRCALRRRSNGVAYTRA
jgi:hypothetical protein